MLPFNKKKLQLSRTVNHRIKFTLKLNIIIFDHIKSGHLFMNLTHNANLCLTQLNNLKVLINP